MIFEYSAQRTFNEMIDIVDIGNTALKCTNVKLEEHYVILKTILGKTYIIKFGPVCPDIDLLVNEFSVSYKKIDYKESQIEKEIDKFINTVNYFVKYNKQDNFICTLYNKSNGFCKGYFRYHQLSLSDLSNKFKHPLLKKMM